MSSLASWLCPKCGHEDMRAEWLGPIKNDEGELIGNRLRCLHCEHFFEDRES